jgi:predicted Rossmann-fold nucleotide-binding protein
LNSDAIVALPGGLGTLDETAEILALRRHNAHQKPVVFLNFDGFYRGMKIQFATMDREGFLGNLDNDVVPGLEGVAHFADTPWAAMEYIERTRP